MGLEAIGGALLTMLAATTPLAAAEDARWELGCCWWELNVEVAARRPWKPLHLDVQLISATVTSGTGRYALDLPMFGFGFDLRRPSGRGDGGFSLSILQAPLLASLLIEPLRDPPVGVAGAILLWLAGGTFRWTPGGPGNLHWSATKATSLALVVKNRFDVLFYNGPSAYLRETVALGLSLRRDDLADRRLKAPDWGCSVGVFASVARESGITAADPGVWASCNVWYVPPLY
jgi:hypothetical protein